MGASKNVVADIYISTYILQPIIGNIDVTLLKLDFLVWDLKSLGQIDSIL